MRFDTIQNYLDRFSICPFCNNQVNKKVWFANRDNSYSFTDENISFFAGDDKLKVFSISLTNDKIETELESSILQAIIHLTKIKLINECEDVSCKMSGCQYKTVSYPLQLNIKNLSVFHPLLDQYTVTVPMGKSFAEYVYIKRINRLRLSVLNYESTIQKNSFNLLGTKPGAWDSYANEMDYKMRKSITYWKDIPFNGLESLTNKENLANKAKMLIVFE